jgi:hypothetical protein
MRTLLLLLVAFVILGAEHLLAESGRLYGKLFTTDNEVFEGWIRWDKNEAYWDDLIDGTCDQKPKDETKSKTGRHYRSKERRTTVSIFGLKFGDEGSVVSLGGSSACQLALGHVRTLLNDGDDEGTLVLKTGDEVTFSSSADLGGSVREILLSDIKEGDIYFDWEDIEKIDFMKEPKDPSDGMERLYGRVSTRRAGEFEGWVEWDVDEVFGKDDLDGEEQGGRTRKITFDRITAIERRSSSSASVTLKDGKEMILSNSNDVNSENRGIVVKSAEFGRIKVSWDDFERVEFMPVPKDKLPKYQDFDGGAPIKGTVTTEDGAQYSGHIAWDDDEEYTWEHINGEYKGIEMDIPFSAIASIEKSSQRGATITVKNGTSYLLRGSNDVDEDNKGILITPDNGKTEEVDWYDFAKLIVK